MADATTTPETSRAATGHRVESFTVEFGDLYCRNHTINCFRLRVRGAWSVTRLHQRGIGGRDIGSAMANMPDIPGQRLRVDPRAMRATVTDPLADNPELLERVNGVSQKVRAFWKGVPFKPVPPAELTLTDDQLVTLLLELHRKREAGQIVVVEGRLPSLETIGKMDGRELFDPWNSGRKPKYADEVAGWSERLDRPA